MVSSIGESLTKKHIFFLNETAIIGNYLSKIEMVFCYQNCSALLWEKIVLFSARENLLKFKAEGQELAKFLRSLEQFI